MSEPAPERLRQVGVEEELLLVDAATGQARSVASEVLQVARARGQDSGSATDRGAVGGSLGAELMEQMVETDTPPERSLARLAQDLRRWREKAGSAAAEAGALVLASGTAPLPVDPETFDDDRYREISARFGLTADEQLSCGCHVHVAVDSDDEAVAVLDRIRVWLPALLAISANSPYWQGMESGYHSYRPQLLSRWPTSGPTDVFGTAAGYRAHLDGLVGTGVLLDEAMVYTDARPSTHFPTIEIRIADVCLEVPDAVLLAALCRGLVETAATAWRSGEPPPPASVPVLRLATWQAAKSGLSGDLLDPRSHRPRPARQVIDELLGQLDAALVRSGDLALVEESVEDLFRRGTGARRQLQAYRDTGRLDRAVLELARITAGS